MSLSCSEYMSLSFREKDQFWSQGYDIYYHSLGFDKVWSFLRDVIQRDDPYFRCQAAKAVAQALFDEKVETWLVLNLYISEWKETNHFFLESIRIRTIALLYAQDKKHIKAVLAKCTDSSNSDIASEAYCQRGITAIWDSGQATSIDSAIAHLRKANEDFSNAIQCSENRIDAKILVTVCEIMLLILQNNPVDSQLAVILELLQATYCANTLSSGETPWFVTISTKVLSLLTAAKDKPDAWIIFKDKIGELCSLISYTLASAYAESLTIGFIDSRIMHLVIDKWMKPMWGTDFQYEMKKIRNTMGTHDVNDPCYLFLLELEGVVKSQKSVSTGSLGEILLRHNISFTPQILEQLTDDTMRGKIDVAIDQILSAAKEKIDQQIVNDVLACCNTLQSGYLTYRSTDENDRNTVIRDLLQRHGYVVQDQHLQGISEGGKRSGETDLTVYWHGAKRTIIEGLNLRSVNRDYISRHANKLFGYDMQGLSVLFLVLYVTVSDFDLFWSNYLAFCATMDYTCEMSGTPVEITHEHAGTDLRMLRTTHMRSGRSVEVYHIALLIPSLP